MSYTTSRDAAHPRPGLVRGRVRTPRLRRTKRLRSGRLRTLADAFAVRARCSPALAARPAIEFAEVMGEAGDVAKSSSNTAAGSRGGSAQKGNGPRLSRTGMSPTLAANARVQASAPRTSR